MLKEELGVSVLSLHGSGIPNCDSAVSKRLHFLCKGPDAEVSKKVRLALEGIIGKVHLELRACFSKRPTSGHSQASLPGADQAPRRPPPAPPVWGHPYPPPWGQQYPSWGGAQPWGPQYPPWGAVPPWANGCSPGRPPPPPPPGVPADPDSAGNAEQKARRNRSGSGGRRRRRRRGEEGEHEADGLGHKRRRREDDGQHVHGDHHRRKRRRRRRCPQDDVGHNETCRSLGEAGDGDIAGGEYFSGSEANSFSRSPSPRNPSNPYLHGSAEPENAEPQSQDLSLLEQELASAVSGFLRKWATTHADGARPNLVLLGGDEAVRRCKDAAVPRQVSLRAWLKEHMPDTVGFEGQSIFLL